MPKHPWSYVILGVVIVTIWGCNLNHPGEEPSRGELYFPIALALPPSGNSSGEESPEPNPPDYLFVVNSNFDLRYNAGSVQAYALNDLQEEIDKCQQDRAECLEKLDRCNDRTTECKDKCGNKSTCRDDCEEDHTCSDTCDPYARCLISPFELLVDEALIGSFASAAAFSPSGKRLYIPTRNNSALSYVDVNIDAKKKDDLMKCQQGEGRRCSEDYVRGTDYISSVRQIELESETVGLVVQRLKDIVSRQIEEGHDPAPIDENDDAILVAHRNGTVSFFISPYKKPDKPLSYRGPNLIDALGGYRQLTTGIGYNPRSGYAYLTSRAIDVSAGSARLDRVGIDYAFGDVSLSQLVNPGYLSLGGLISEVDTNAIEFYPEKFPEKAFVVSRLPNAFLVVDMNPGLANTREVLIQRIVEVGNGASRLTLGQIGHDPRLFAFVSCFNSRELYIIDVELGEPVAIIQGFSGPFDLVLDQYRKMVYVADFRSSIIRIVDLAPIVCTEDIGVTDCSQNSIENGGSLPCKCLKNRVTRIIATLGIPRPPEEII